MLPVRSKHAANQTNILFKTLFLRKTEQATFMAWLH